MVQGFFVGMAANLIPSPAGGVGSVDAGMIAAFVLFDIPTATVFAAVLTYRVIAFWLPIPLGHHRLHPAAEYRCGLGGRGPADGLYFRK